MIMSGHSSRIRRGKARNRNEKLMVCDSGTSGKSDPYSGDVNQRCRVYPETGIVRSFALDESIHPNIVVFGKVRGHRSPRESEESFGGESEGFVDEVGGI